MRRQIPREDILPNLQAQNVLISREKNNSREGLSIFMLDP